MPHGSSEDPHRGTVSVSYRSGIALITLGADRADEGPQLDAGAVRALYDALTLCDQDESIRVVVLSSLAEDFCLGMDLSQAAAAGGGTKAGRAAEAAAAGGGTKAGRAAEAAAPGGGTKAGRAAEAAAAGQPGGKTGKAPGQGQRMDHEHNSVREAIEHYSSALGLLETGSFVSLAVVGGHAAAGGVGLVAACSIVLASESARFSLPEVLYGLVAANVLPSLRRRVSRASCEYLAISRASWDAHTAEVRGLVDEVVESEALRARSRRIIRDVLRNDPDAMRTTRGFLAGIDEHGVAEARGEAVGLLAERITSGKAVAAMTSLEQGHLPPWSLPMPKDVP